MQDGCNFEDFINSTCAPSSPTKVINHSDPAASIAPSHPPLLHHSQGQVRPAGPLSGADVVLPQQKRRRTASSHQPSASHVPAAMGNSSGAVDSARPQALSNPIDHIFQFHKASLLCFLQHVYLQSYSGSAPQGPFASSKKGLSIMRATRAALKTCQFTAHLANVHDCSCTCPRSDCEPSLHANACLEHHSRWRHHVINTKPWQTLLLFTVDVGSTHCDNCCTRLIPFAVCESPILLEPISQQL